MLHFLFVWLIVTAGVFAFWALFDLVFPTESGELSIVDFPFHVQLIGNGMEALALTIVGYILFTAF